MSDNTMEFIEIRHPSNWLLMSDSEREDWENNLKYDIAKTKRIIDDKMKELFYQSLTKQSKEDKE